MIKCRLGVLVAEKASREGRKITYRTIETETGLSTAIIVRLNATNFGTRSANSRVDINTLDTLCTYLGCEIGDLLKHIPETQVREGGTTSESDAE